ncbi:hypothetical protein L227DRAFT_85853 [Lentinus tigrinus ALCF2SS1-6]|uniref:Uncharacterized protein n=1 Tax=Lentinus tigrinus ALCF2SS1-6 TaxID=1328759 RepID=A0A5C2SCG9_9APHY|nr:hypothetical protein L227DRAFT_85853 [Lentinus tigrinus ALCF2SS1-6]
MLRPSPYRDFSVIAQHPLTSAKPSSTPHHRSIPPGFPSDDIPPRRPARHHHFRSRRRRITTCLSITSPAIAPRRGSLTLLPCVHDCHKASTCSITRPHAPCTCTVNYPLPLPVFPHLFYPFPVSRACPHFLLLLSLVRLCFSLAMRFSMTSATMTTVATRHGKGTRKGKGRAAVAIVSGPPRTQAAPHPWPDGPFFPSSFFDIHDLLYHWLPCLPPFRLLRVRTRTRVYRVVSVSSRFVTSCTSAI